MKIKSWQVYYLMDSDPLPDAHDDFCSIFTDVIGHIPFKFLTLMFVVFMVLSTDTFINRVLGVFSGAVTNGIPTSYGTTLQGLFLVLAMVMIDPLIKLKLI